MSKQVASIDLSGRPEGATHYSVNRPDSCVANWYKLESGKWKFWALKRWATITGTAPIKEVFEIPTQPDWSKGPADATHWGAAAKPGQDLLAYVECFYKFDGDISIVATEMFDWTWRKSSQDVAPERRAMLIERPVPKADPDWDSAPDWAAVLLVNTSHPSMYAWAKAFEKGARFERLDGTDCTAHLLPEFWEVVGERPFVSRDFSGSVIAHGLPLIVKPWEGDLPPAGHPVDYLGLDGEMKDGTYVGSYLGQAVVACRESGVVGFLDYAADKMVWERPQWDGEGNPPAGIECEVREPKAHSGFKDWSKCTVAAYNTGSSGGPQICVVDDRGDFAIFYPSIDSVEFRPIRTPEQIAADERLHKIRNACTDIARTLDRFNNDIPGGSTARAVIEAMIDAGYARPVKA